MRPASRPSFTRYSQNGSSAGSARSRCTSPMKTRSLPGRKARLAKRGEGPRADRFAQLLHETQIEGQVVNGVEARAEDLVGYEQVPQVGPGVLAARLAGALGIERARVAPELFALDVDPSLGR